MLRGQTAFWHSQLKGAVTTSSCNSMFKLAQKAMSEFIEAFG